MSLPTIKAPSDISRMFSSGSRVSNRYITFIYSNIDLNDKHDRKGRVAFIAGKKNGNAVWRNSAKRRMREIYISQRHKLENIDILFIAKPPLLEDSYSKVLKTCETTINRIGQKKNKTDR